MGIREIFGALGRRWYIVVAGLLLTLGAGWQVYQMTPAEYTARSLTLLLPPVGDPTAETDGANPFLSLSGLDLTARVVVATYSSTAFAEDLEEFSPYAEVEVTIDDSTRGGIIAVEAKDRGEAQTLETLDYVTQNVSDRLVGLQQEVGVPDKDTVRSMLLAVDTEAERDFQSLIRILVIVVGGGLGLTFAIALLLDVIVIRRRRRHDEFGPVGSAARWKRMPEHAEPGKNVSPSGAAEATVNIESEQLPALDDEPIAADNPQLDFDETLSAPAGPRSAQNPSPQP